MNLPKKVNKKIENLDINEIKKYLNNILRKIPNSRYEEVLLMFEDEIKIDMEEVRNKLEYYQEKFKLIDDGELLFHATGYEEYGDYYSWNNDWIWEYTDEEDVGDLINEASLEAIRLVNNKEYVYSRKIFNLLFSTNYQYLDDDGGDIFEISLKGLMEEGLININLDKLALYYIYATYQGTLVNNRANEIYRLFKNDNFKEINIEDAFNLGIEVLDKQDEFWDDWMNVLSLNAGNIEYRLLKRAFEYNEFRGYDKYLDNINKYHPRIYIDIFDYLKNQDKLDELIKIGNEGLEKIDKDLRIRQDISLYLANIDSSNNEKYIIDAYYSNTSVINLLRIINNGYYYKYKDEIKNKINYCNLDKLVDYKNETINVIDKKSYYVLKFFSGEYEELFGECLKHKKMLGWSGSSIQLMVYLFILMLNKSNLRTSSYMTMLDYVFREFDFNKDNGYFLDDDIYNIFTNWKEKFELSDDLVPKVIDWLMNIIDLRVNAIISGNYRTSYYKAALLIVSLDELLSSRDMISKNEIVDLYMKKYSRFSALRKEIKKLVNEV